MQVVKSFLISTSSTSIRATICEILDHADGSTFTWPSSQLLAAYLVHKPEEVLDKTVLELGAGTGLPSIASCLCGAKYAYMTDREGEDELYKLLDRTIAMNRLQEVCLAMPLAWGSTVHLQLLSKVDVILGADVFYNPEDFENIFSTLAYFMEVNPDTVFLTTYQERSSHRTIKHLLQRHCLLAEHIPSSDFLHSAHMAGICAMLSSSSDGDTEDTDIDLNSFHDIHLIRIRKRCADLSYSI